MITERIPLWEGREDVALHTMLRKCAPLPMQTEPPEALPAVIVCPGGAYLFCSVDLEGDTTALSFADKGYQTFILEYTVGSQCGDIDSRYPAQLLDLAKAILIIREHANEWHVDTERISIAGFSAGANLCANMAVHWHESLLADHFGVDSSVFKPLTVILGYALIDYRYQEEYMAEALPGNSIMMGGNKTVFGTPTPTPEQCDELSPHNYVSDKTPPVFMVHAANDTLVPAVHSLKMAAALAKKGIPYELHIFQNGEHGFATGIPSGVGPYRSDKKMAVSAWVDLCAEWLMHYTSPETAEHDNSVAASMRRSEEARRAAAAKK